MDLPRPIIDGSSSQSCEQRSRSCFTAAVAQAIADLLPTLTTRITDEIRQNKNNENNANRRNARRVNTRGSGNDGDAQPTDIHVWLERILNTEFTDVAQVANAARNIEIFRDRSKNEGNNKRDRDGHRIRPSDTPSQGPNQRAYDRRNSERYRNNDRYNDRLGAGPELECTGAVCSVSSSNAVATASAQRNKGALENISIDRALQQECGDFFRSQRHSG
ncbi:hypothetical protein Tco_0659363 [Tanacetum coccineum]